MEVLDNNMKEGFEIWEKGCYHSFFYFRSSNIDDYFQAEAISEENVK